MVEPIVVGESKYIHKGSMIGHISNGGGIIPISNGLAIRPIAVNENYIKIQILNYGLGVEIKEQKWKRVPKVKVTKVIVQQPKPEPKVKEEPTIFKAKREEDEYI